MFGGVGGQILYRPIEKDMHLDYPFTELGNVVMSKDLNLKTMKPHWSFRVLF